MKIEIYGDALKLLEDFVKYANLDPEAMADVMAYDYEGFKCRLGRLSAAIIAAEK